VQVEEHTSLEDHAETDISAQHYIIEFFRACLAKTAHSPTHSKRYLNVCIRKCSIQIVSAGKPCNVSEYVLANAGSTRNKFTLNQNGTSTRVREPNRPLVISPSNWKIERILFEHFSSSPAFLAAPTNSAWCGSIPATPGCNNALI
jgi:hypothetical protein